ncbi:MAG: hypothetical protein ACYC69_00490 [Thermodesulfovibrionales bacterium]
MIIPQPESDMSMNLMVVASDILDFLRGQKDSALVDNVLKAFLSKDTRRTPDMFFDAVTYLYSLGIIREQEYKMRVVYGDTQKTLY